MAGGRRVVETLLSLGLGEASVQLLTLLLVGGVCFLFPAVVLVSETWRLSRPVYPFVFDAFQINHAVTRRCRLL